MRKFLYILLAASLAIAGCQKPDDTPEAEDITPEAEAIGSYTFDGTDFSLELLSTELEPYPQAVD